MKRILLLHRGGRGGIRGTEACVIQSAKALHAAGFAVSVLRNLDVMDARLQPYVAECVDFEFPELGIDGRHTRLPLWRYWKALGALGDFIRRYQPSLVYASGGLPCQLAVPAARRARLPLLCHYHHPVGRRWYYLWLVRAADALMFPSEYTRDDAHRKAGVHGEVVYNGVDLDVFSPAATADGVLRARHGIAEDSVVVGQVGQLVPHKRPELLLEAFLRIAPQLPSLHLCLVGRGPLEDRLRSRVAESGLENRITVTGYVDDVAPYYRDVLDINVLASVQEGLGISVIEGAACGLPAVVSNATGLPETIVPGQTGLLFEPDDMAGLAESLMALAKDASRRRTMGAAARALAESKFSAVDYGRRVVELVEQVRLANGRNQARAGSKTRME